MEHCCEKIKIRDENEKKLLLNRLSRIEGITQVAAVDAALASFNKELLASHINTCVADDIKEGNAEKTEELIELLGKLIK